MPQKWLSANGIKEVDTGRIELPTSRSYIVRSVRATTVPSALDSLICYSGPRIGRAVAGWSTKFDTAMIPVLNCTENII